MQMHSTVYHSDVYYLIYTNVVLNDPQSDKVWSLVHISMKNLLFYVNYQRFLAGLGWGVAKTSFV